MFESTRWSRREFTRFGMSLTVAAHLLNERAASADPTTGLPTADQFIVGKDKRLIVHSTKTGELETPLTLLREHSITPKEYLFVRNNQVLPGTLTVESPSRTIGRSRWPA